LDLAGYAIKAHTGDIGVNISNISDSAIISTISTGTIFSTKYSIYVEGINNNITLSNIDISGDPSSPDGFGIFFWGVTSDNFTIDAITNAYHQDGIRFAFSSHLTDLVIKNSNISNNSIGFGGNGDLYEYRDGGYFTNLTLSGNIFANNTGTAIIADHTTNFGVFANTLESNNIAIAVSNTTGFQLS
jgi:hypothetical protein